MPYAQAWAWQQSLVAARKVDPSLPDALILLEHFPVYTLGQGADPQFLRFDPATSPYELHRVERGGEVTYHAPGQLVGYPILNLMRHRRDLSWYLRQLEEVIIRVLAEYGLRGERVSGLTGVWLEDYKVAAIGIKVSRWITMHGFALNVCPEMQGFDRIVPCGLAHQPVGCLTQWLPNLTVDAVAQVVAPVFAEVFNLRLTVGPKEKGGALESTSPPTRD
jgi:lipoyl(octanoyl) transferase